MKLVYSNDRVVDNDGKFTTNWETTMRQFIQLFGARISDNGLNVPQLSTAEIANMAHTKFNGFLVYDSDIHVLKIILNGSVKTIQTF